MNYIPAKHTHILIPNTETVEAMLEARRGDLVTIGAIDDLMADLHDGDSTNENS